MDPRDFLPVAELIRKSLFSGVAYTHGGEVILLAGGYPIWVSEASVYINEQSSLPEISLGGLDWNIRRIPFELVLH